MGIETLGESEAPVLWRYRNREIRATDLDSLRLLLAQHSQAGRKAFPRVVCEAWGWRQANGAWSECACRDLLLRLEERGEIVLPVRRQARPRRRQLPLWPIELMPLVGLEVCDPHADLSQITVRPIAAAERLGWRLFMARYHYLGYRAPIGEHLLYAAFLDEELVALLGWAAAALHAPLRERYIGWDQPTKRQRLHLVVNNVRFLVLPWVRVKNLASKVLALTDEGLMGLLGFNAYQVEHGANARGLGQRTQPVSVRGAFSYETVADNLVAISPSALVDLFNGAVRCLARQGVLAKHLDVVLDATDDEATPTYQTDDGRPVPRVTREKRPEVRANRHAQKVEVTAYGWKLWIVWEPQSKIPLAITIGDIQESDNKHAYAVLAQARKNVEGYATIRSVALDRGFLDGKLLAAIEADGILIYIPAKSNMTVTQEARSIARRAAAAMAQGRSVAGCVYRERHDTVTRGSGKKARTETRTTTLVGIGELPCDWWNPQGSNSQANRKDFLPKLLRATVVLRWDGAPKDAEKEVVLLTTDPTVDPFVAFDAYDDRSRIENSCNREAKEHWFLEHHPKRSEAGVRVHAYFVFLCMALVAGFRAYKSQSDEAERRGQDLGITRYRRALERENRDKVVVFIGERFGIFRSYEFALLVGVTVKERTLMGETIETVLSRYGVRGSDTS